MDRIVLDSPLDMHVHFRTGNMLKFVVPYTACNFAGAMVMPNTDPIIDNHYALCRYREEIKAACKDAFFEPYMTLYFQTSYTRQMLEECRQDVLAIKLYPRGITTNSGHGVLISDPEVETVLGYMTELGIPLSVHGETDGYVMRREREFMRTYERWAVKYPKLKIIMEHISTAEAVNVLGTYPNVFATVTPHHLLMTTDDLCGDMLRPHLFCKPLLKSPEDRAALQALVLGELSDELQRKVMLGTDSAPHAKNKKECDCGCAGVFNAPYALPSIVPLFVEKDKLPELQRFVSDNAKAIYGIDTLPKMVELHRESQRANAFLGHLVGPKDDSYVCVVPMYADQILRWRVRKTWVDPVRTKVVLPKSPLAK
jgi:dihydroorotase